MIQVIQSWDTETAVYNDPQLLHFWRAVAPVSVGVYVQWETEQKKVTANRGYPQKQPNMMIEGIDTFSAIVDKRNYEEMPLWE